MLSALAILYTFYIFILRQKLYNTHACKKMVANLINGGLAVDRKLSAFVNQEIESRKLSALRIELGKC